MEKNQNGVEAPLFSVALDNKPGSLEKFLGLFKTVNITGMKLINNGEIGTIQFVVDPSSSKPMISHSRATQTDEQRLRRGRIWGAQFLRARCQRS